MPAQVLSTVENNFTKGLITEFTGLNFPENAATDTTNCIYTIVGDVIRREGFDYETNFAFNNIERNNRAINQYKWNNVNGNSNTQIVVEQIGSLLIFYLASSATSTAPLSTTKIASTVDITSFLASGSSVDPSQLECQFSDGNGYLFVYHPNCDPFYCTYAGGVITGTAITVQIRDFLGVNDGLAVTTRPNGLNLQHGYNLQNQGWGSVWNDTSVTSLTVGLGSKTFTVTSATLPVQTGDIITLTNGVNNMQGPVTSYTGTTLSINVSKIGGTGTFSAWTVIPINEYAQLWVSFIGGFPSNSDVWWTYKNTSGVFDPVNTLTNVTAQTSPAAKGHYILNAFNQNRYQFLALGSNAGIPDITTTVRPKTGTWFQGRVWYTGVDANTSVAGIGTTNYSWTENIYFSQIVVSPTDFGHCYQTNDPTSEKLFGLLPTDGGVIQIQGCGSIYKLFPLQNALLVFAANGVWYLTGSTGIGFTANDYTIVKLSSVRSISSTSFIDVQGLPIFWNEEGIYKVEPAKQGNQLLNSPLHVNPLEVNPLTVGTILTFYGNIPLQSKKYARGDYNTIDYTVQWTYRSTNETSVTDRYQFDSILNLNTVNKAFYPYSLSNSITSPYIHGIMYVAGPGGSTSPSPVFKYLTSIKGGLSYNFTFSEERDPTFVDWFSNDKIGINFISYFVTGYKLHGQGQRRFQIPYLYVYSRALNPTSYKIQGIWDYAITGDSGRWSTSQRINNWSPNFGVVIRRHRIRGQGLVLQIKVSSSDKQPFDILGWSAFETMNQGV